MTSTDGPSGTDRPAPPGGGAPPASKPAGSRSSAEFRAPLASTSFGDRSGAQASGFRACPRCGGAIQFTRCVWCGSRFHRNCATCGDIGCAAIDCSEIFQRRMFFSVLGGLIVTAMAWLVLRYFVGNPWESPTTTLHRTLAEGGHWHEGMSYAAYAD